MTAIYTPLAVTPRVLEDPNDQALRRRVPRVINSTVDPLSNTPSGVSDQPQPLPRAAPSNAARVSVPVYPMPAVNGTLAEGRPIITGEQGAHILTDQGIQSAAGPKFDSMVRPPRVRPSPPRQEVMFPNDLPYNGRVDEGVNSAGAPSPVGTQPRRTARAAPQLDTSGPQTKLPRAQDYMHGQRQGDNRFKDAAKAGLKGLLTLNPGYALGRFAGVLVNPQAVHDEQYRQDMARVQPQYNAEQKAIDEHNKALKDQYDLDIKGVNAGETMARTDESYAKAEDSRAAARDRAAYQQTQISNMQADNKRADQSAAEQRALAHIKYAQATGSPVRPDAVKGTQWEYLAGQVPPRETEYQLEKDGEGQLWRVPRNVPGAGGEIVPDIRMPVPRAERSKQLGDEDPDTVHNRAVGQMKDWEHKRNVVVPQEEAQLQRINEGIATLEKGDDLPYDLDAPMAQAMAQVAHMRGDVTKAEVRAQFIKDKLNYLYARRNEQEARVTAARQDRDSSGDRMSEEYSKYPGFVEYGEGSDPAKTKYMKLHPERLDPNYRAPRVPKRTGQPGSGSPLNGRSPFIQ